MEITSLQYLIFGIVFIAIFFQLSTTLKRWFILFASYFFYFTYSPILLGALVSSTLINYWISNKGSSSSKYLGITFNLLLLLIFKSAGLIGQGDLLIPIGISFFTFQGVSYLLNRKNKVELIEHNLLDFANYMAFFPQLIAGPIEEFNHLGGQLTYFKKFQFENLKEGLYHIVIGLSKKLIIADRCGIIVNQAYNELNQSNLLTLWVAGFLFTCQISLDFSAYCDIAKGVAKIIGINLSQNFKSPYLSTSLADFWRRWHITLHHWFKTYVYQNIKSNKGWLFASLSIFILSGIWHGIALNFILWGSFCFISFLIDKLIIQKYIKLKLFTWLLMYVSISIGWIFFRIETITDVFYFFQPSKSLNSTALFNSVSDYWYFLSHLSEASWFGKISIGEQGLNISNIDFTVLVLGLITWGILSLPVFQRINKIKTSTIFMLLILVAILGYNSNEPFIYLQF